MISRLKAYIFTHPLTLYLCLWQDKRTTSETEQSRLMGRLAMCLASYSPAGEGRYGLTGPIDFRSVNHKHLRSSHAGATNALTT